MQMTIVEANKYARQLTEEVARIEKEEASASVLRYSEGEEPIPQEYDFAKTQSRIADLNEKIARIRHAVNRFNAETVVAGYPFTVDEALVRISMMAGELKKLADMKNLPSVSRKAGYSNVEIARRNFDIDEVLKKWSDTTREINRLRAALDLTNLTSTIEIEGIDG